MLKERQGVLMDERLAQFEDKMQKTLENLDRELSTIRAGRANPRVLDRVYVDYYGTSTPINQVGNISVPEARTLLIAPWEPSMLKNIEKALLASDVGITPTNDGQNIRLNFPELTEERRRELAKDVKKKAENSKVAIRNIRRDANDSFKKAEKAKEITEDELKDLNDAIQKSTDSFIDKIDKAVDVKTTEIMTV